MYIQVEKNQQSGNYEVTPNVTPTGVRVYQYISEGYPFFSSKQILEVGDTVRGSFYEGSSLDTELTVHAVLTRAEYWAAIGYEDNGYNADARIYLFNDGSPSSSSSYFAKATDFENPYEPEYYDL